MFLRKPLIPFLFYFILYIYYSSHLIIKVRELTTKLILFNYKPSCSLILFIKPKLDEIQPRQKQGTNEELVIMKQIIYRPKFELGYWLID